MEQPAGAGSPSQQLGAVPGTVSMNAVPGYQGNEPEGSLDGAEFASSAEAETAPRDVDFDVELPDDVLREVQQANNFATTRDLENMDYVGTSGMIGMGSMNYGESFAER